MLGGDWQKLPYVMPERMRVQHQADLTHYTQFPAAVCKSCFMFLFRCVYLYSGPTDKNHSLVLKWAQQAGRKTLSWNPCRAAGCLCQPEQQPKVTPEWHKWSTGRRTWSRTALSIPAQPIHPLLKHCTENPLPSTKAGPLCRDKKCQQKRYFSEKNANFSSLAMREFVEGIEVTALLLTNFFNLLLKTSFMWTTEIVRIEGKGIQINSLPNYKAIIHSHPVVK